jgi:hypothetical protein
VWPKLLRVTSEGAQLTVWKRLRVGLSKGARGTAFWTVGLGETDFVAGLRQFARKIPQNPVLIRDSNYSYNLKTLSRRINSLQKEAIY